MCFAFLVFRQELGFLPEIDLELSHHRLPAFCTIGRVAVYGREEFG